MQCTILFLVNIQTTVSMGQFAEDINGIEQCQVITLRARLFIIC